MRILRDVKCQLTDRSLVGKLVIKDDSPFEGILIDTKSKNKYLIFGELSMGNLNLVAFNSHDNSRILLFPQLKKMESFVGEGYSYNGRIKQSIGFCDFRLYDPNYYRDVNYGEIIGVLANTHILKAEMSNMAYQAYEEYLDKDSTNEKKLVR